MPFAGSTSPLRGVTGRAEQPQTKSSADRLWREDLLFPLGGGESLPSPLSPFTATQQKRWRSRYLRYIGAPLLSDEPKCVVDHVTTSLRAQCSLCRSLPRLINMSSPVAVQPLFSCHVDMTEAEAMSAWADLNGEPKRERAPLGEISAPNTAAEPRAAVCPESIGCSKTHRDSRGLEQRDPGVTGVSADAGHRAPDQPFSKILRVGSRYVFHLTCSAVCLRVVLYVEVGGCSLTS